MLARKYKLSLRYGLVCGVISAIRRDKVNKQVVCFTDDLGTSFYGAYSFGYYRRVFNSLDMPVSLKVLA